MLGRKEIELKVVASRSVGEEIGLWVFFMPGELKQVVKESYQLLSFLAGLEELISESEAVITSLGS